MDEAGLQQNRKIGPETLQGKSYFSSLLHEALVVGSLDGQDAERIQLECLQLLAARTALYTKGESSSVRVDTARQLMESNLFTLGLALKAYASPDDAAKALHRQPISTLFEQGRKRIDIKLKSVRQLHHMAVKSLPKTENRACFETIGSGIQGFLKLYNPDFGAHEIHITVDYPLCNPINDLNGIEFIQRYLECILLENEFCTCFPGDTIHCLLRGYDRNYRALLLNICQAVLGAALGVVLTGGEPRELRLLSTQVDRLQQQFAWMGREELTALLKRAAETLLDTLGLHRNSLRRYIHQAIPELAANAEHMAQHRNLREIFIVPDCSQSK